MIVCRVLSNMKKNFQISEKDIALFVSGELSPAKEKFIQDAIDRDKKLQAYISKLQQVDALVLSEFSEDYPIPDEFRSFVQEKLESNELSFFGRLKKRVGLISVLSGSLGAGVAAPYYWAWARRNWPIDQAMKFRHLTTRSYMNGQYQIN